MKIAVEHLASEAITGITTYTSSSWTAGSLIKKRSDLTTLPFIGPIVDSVARPVEQAAAIPGVFPHVISWSSNVDWVFLADNATAAATRRLQVYTFDKTAGTFAWLGFITLTYPAATVGHTITGFRMTLDNYTTGTISGGTTNVVGTGTNWVVNRQNVGCRIGFGSTDPTKIVNWYVINTIASDTVMTLTTTLSQTYPAGTAYVLEDLRAVTVTRNTTTTNGGVFVTKGLNINLFTSLGTTIPAAVSTDLIRAVYWLADASTVLNVTSAGCGLDTKTGQTYQALYVLDAVSAGNAKVFKYNIRKALTLASGKDVTTALLTTGIEAVTGNVPFTNNSRLCTLNHGPASGVPALYFVTPTRIYCAKLSSIQSASVTWFDYTMTEVPPGGVGAYAAGGALNAVEYVDTLDRLLITSLGTAGARSYITQFNNTGAQIDHIFLIDDKQIDQGSTDPTVFPPHPAILANILSPDVQNGLMYIVSIGTTAPTNIMHVAPVGADWNYAATTGQRLITPKFLTPNCNKYARVYIVRDGFLGSDINRGKTSDGFRLYYRTASIDSDATTGWNLIADGNDLSGVAANTQIQFMIEFKCISDLCLPARIFLVGVVYDDLSTDSHYQPSANFSNVTTKKFAWRFSSTFGTTVPTLRIRLYDAVLGTLLCDDNSATPSGTWEKSTNDGGGWGAYDTLDKTNETTYIRYTPASLGDNIKVKSLLTLN